jgi:hypothetical protein
MQNKLFIKNIVLAGAFGLPIFDKYFFIKNNIIKEEEMLVGTIFDAIGAIQVVCKKFNIVIASNQFIITGTNEDDSDTINDVISKIVSASSGSIKINAMGMNFHWHLGDKNQALEKTSRDYFYNDKINLMANFFKSSDSMFGFYASTNFKDARLKLDVKPAIVNKIQEGVKENYILFAFNFHFDVKDNTQALKNISEYSSYKEESRKIILTYK